MGGFWRNGMAPSTAQLLQMLGKITTLLFSEAPGLASHKEEGMDWKCGLSLLPLLRCYLLYTHEVAYTKYSDIPSGSQDVFQSYLLFSHAKHCRVHMGKCTIQGYACITWSDSETCFISNLQKAAPSQWDLEPLFAQPVTLKRSGLIYPLISALNRAP